MNRTRKKKLKQAGTLAVAFVARCILIEALIIFGAYEYADVFAAWKPILAATLLGVYFSYLIIDSRSAEGEG